MSATATPWKETFSIRTYEAGPTGAATVQSLCNYLQETAANHAADLGFSVEHLEAHNLTWVLSRLSVEVQAYPVWRDRVEITTWPSGENGLYALRDFRMTGPDGTSLLRATSAWLLIDLNRRRPSRIPDFVRAILPQNPERALEDDLSRLNPVREALYQRTFRVRYSDLDLNRHVNNVRYIDWALESLPRSVVQDRQLNAITIHFRSETEYEDTVVAAAEAQTNGEILQVNHQLLRESDRREVARAQTTWSDTTTD